MKLTYLLLLILVTGCFCNCDDTKNVQSASPPANDPKPMESDQLLESHYVGGVESKYTIQLKSQLEKLHPTLKVNIMPVSHAENRLSQVADIVMQSRVREMLQHVPPEVGLSNSLEAVNGEEAIFSFLERYPLPVEEFKFACKAAKSSLHGLPDNRVQLNSDFVTISTLLLYRARLDAGKGDVAAAVEIMSAVVSLEEAMRTHEMPTLDDYTSCGAIRRALLFMIRSCTSGKSLFSREEIAVVRSSLVTGTLNPVELVRSLILAQWNSEFSWVTEQDVEDSHQEFFEYVVGAAEISELMIANLGSLDLTTLDFKDVNWLPLDAAKFSDYQLTFFGRFEHSVDRLEEGFILEVRRMALLRAAIAIAVGEKPDQDPVRGGDFEVDSSGGKISFEVDAQDDLLQDVRNRVEQNIPVFLAR